MSVDNELDIVTHVFQNLPAEYFGVDYSEYFGVRYSDT